MQICGGDGLLSVALAGGNGNDTAKIDFACTTLDVGKCGTLALKTSGDCGNDCVQTNARVSATSSGFYDIAACGGDNDDKVGLAFQNDNTSCNTPDHYAGGKALLDGGKGCDQWDQEGNAPVCVINVETSNEALEPEFALV